MVFELRSSSDKTNIKFIINLGLDKGFERVVKDYVALSVMVGALFTYFGSIAVKRALHENLIIGAASLIFIFFLLLYFIEGVADSLTENLRPS